MCHHFGTSENAGHACEVAGCKAVCSTGAPRAKLSDGRVFVRGRSRRGAIDSSNHVTVFESSKSSGGTEPSE